VRIEQEEIERFIKLANAWRNTPIVDDDFPLMRDRFDLELRRLTKKLDDIKEHQRVEAGLDRRERAGEFGKF